jgi:hypothetical protein
VGHLLFCIGAVRCDYEVRFPYTGFGRSAFFQSSRACSSGAGEILLLWGDGSALSLSGGSGSLLCLSYSLCFGYDTPFCTGRVVVAYLFSDKHRTESPFCFGPYGATSSDASPNSLLIRGVPGNDSGVFTSVL